jgi:hypothetical protein
MLDIRLGDGDDFRGVTLALAVLKACRPIRLLPGNVLQLEKHLSQILVEKASPHIRIAFIFAESPAFVTHDTLALCTCPPANV